MASSESTAVKPRYWGLSSNLSGLSSNPAEESGDIDDTEKRCLLNELAARIGAVGQHRPPKVLQELAVALCKFWSFREDELTYLASRNVETVRANNLRPL